jgi:hypothetical protein
MKTKTLILGFTIILIGGAHADLISYTGSSYQQDFDSLASAPVGNIPRPTWSDGDTLTGWFASVSDVGGAPSDYIVGNGNFFDVGELHSLGVAGANPVTDRALATQSTQASTERIGVAFSNDSASAFRQFQVTYDGEHWRRINNEGADRLDVEFQIFATGQGSLTAGGTWTALPGLTFTSPTFGIAGSTALDGNLAGNRVAGLTATISGIDWDPSEELWIRFSDGAANAQFQMGVDNFMFSAAIPEPASLAFLVLGAVLLLPGCLRRRP